MTRAHKHLRMIFDHSRKWGTRRIPGQQWRLCEIQLACRGGSMRRHRQVLDYQVAPLTRPQQRAQGRRTRTCRARQGLQTELWQSRAPARNISSSSCQNAGCWLLLQGDCEPMLQRESLSVLHVCLRLHCCHVLSMGRTLKDMAAGSSRIVIASRRCSVSPCCTFSPVCTLEQSRQQSVGSKSMCWTLCATLHAPGCCREAIASRCGSVSSSASCMSVCVCSLIMYCQWAAH